MAPIVIFAYNRLRHIMNCIESLSKAQGAINSDLYIFSDGAPIGQEENVNAVREYINQKELTFLFNSVCVIEAKENQGLAKSIIQGVTKVIKKYGICIVLEDDVIVTKDFLLYMNDAIDFYKNHNRVWSIAGMSLINPDKVLQDVYFMGRVCSCAWATWENRWETVDWEVKDYNKFRFNLIKRYKFNRFGTDRSNMLDRQMMRKITSWAICFDYAEFNHRMVTVYPKYTKAKDNGHDGSGTHFTIATGRLNVVLPDVVNEYMLTDCVKIDSSLVYEFNNFFGLRWQARLKRFILREIENTTGKKVFK